MTGRPSLHIDLNARPRRSLLLSRGGKLAFGLTLIVGLVVAEVWLPPAIGGPILLAMRWLLAGMATFVLGAALWLRSTGTALTEEVDSAVAAQLASAGLEQASRVASSTKLPGSVVLASAALAAYLLWRAVAETLAALG